MDFKKYLSSGSTDPKQILKFVLGFAAVMLVLWLVMVSQMDFTGSGGPSTPEDRMRADSLRSAISQDSVQVQPRESEEESPDIFFNALTTFLILITLLGLVWIWTRSKGNSPQQRSNMFNEVGGQMLGQGAQLKVIEINDEIWVMSVTEGSVSLLHRYAKEDWKGKIEHGEPIESSFYKMFKGEKK
ncbi:flagellar biosynthetic protein FliO [Rhodohalobacter sp. 8-1]|uniref:flagellar biosynthetic protein FliO n=1 Tax=Rhodohalobacter sp. 8-1 TaxID=3131972 RepID=UPI0030EB6C08